MDKEMFNCKPCNYFTTKKHIYEKHLNRETHLKNVAKAKNNIEQPLHLPLPLQMKENTSIVLETTTYSTTNSTTDYDIHIDTSEFILMMNESLAKLKETGDKKKFVSGFFDYMFKHVTDIRHFEESKTE
jgi:hypothetical protein